MPGDGTNALTKEEHHELGRELENTKARLAELAGVVESVYGRQNRSAFAFEKVSEAMEHLLAELAAQAAADCPGTEAAQWYRGAEGRAKSGP